MQETPCPRQMRGYRWHMADNTYLKAECCLLPTNYRSDQAERSTGKAPSESNNSGLSRAYRAAASLTTAR